MESDRPVFVPSLIGAAAMLLRQDAPIWTRAVRRGEILSRQRVTNRAILDAIARCAPRSLLDLGCGEGWLAHHCARESLAVLGTDGVAGLTAIAAAGLPRSCSLVLPHPRILAAAVSSPWPDPQGHA